MEIANCWNEFFYWRINCRTALRSRRPLRGVRSAVTHGAAVSAYLRGKAVSARAADFFWPRWKPARGAPLQERSPRKMHSGVGAFFHSLIATGLATSAVLRRRLEYEVEADLAAQAPATPPGLADCVPRPGA